MSKLNLLKKINFSKNNILIGAAVIAIIITGVLIFSNSYDSFSLPNILGFFFGPSNDQIAKKAIDYINTNQLSSSPASLVGVSEESGLVKIKIKIDTAEFDSYATKDGKLLFPQAFDMSSQETAVESNQNESAANSNKTSEKALASIAKNDSPMLEAYVVSRCPFGLQMQRAMADAIESLPDLAKYMTVRYIGGVSSSGNATTSMHGNEEATENLRQICIREEQPAKYWDYVACQMKSAGTETSCEKSTGVDSAALNACMSNTNRGIAYAQKDFALNNKYGINGSPTLILDGAPVSEFDFGGRTSDALKSIVCAALNTELSFCSQTLNTTDAAASFYATYAAAGNSASSGTNCATQ